MKGTLILVFGMLILNPNICISQSLLKHIELSLGFSAQDQDRRLFDWPTKEEIINHENSKYDYQFEILLSKSVLRKGKLEITTGLGFNLITSTFSRPYDNNYFTGGSNQWLWYIKEYKIHNLKLSSVIKYNLIGQEKNKFIFVLPVGMNFELNKHVKAGNHIVDKWKFGLNNLDLYAGLGYQSSKFAYYISYRLINFQKIDRVIFNDKLFYGISDPILINKYETNNLTNFKGNICFLF